MNHQMGSIDVANVTDGQKDTASKLCCRPLLRRYVIATLAFFGFWNIYALRVNLSVAVVAMTTNYSITTPGTNETTYRQDFDWDLPTRGLLLSSFFYGYVVTQIPGGWLATRFGGGARVYGAGVVATALLTLLTPPVARSSLTALFVLRVVEGFCEGVTFPSIHAVWSQWAPPLERSRLATIAFSGSYFGTVISLPLSSILANAFGWEAIFYVFGVIGLIWSALWFWLVYERPHLDPRISKEELAFIEDSLGGKQSLETHHPWRKFMTSLPVWSIVMAHFSENWGFYTLLTQLPTFMKDTLHFDLKNAGFLSALPYLAMTIVLQAAGYLADYLRTLSLTAKKGKIVSYVLSTTGVRKVFNCGAFLCQTVFMLLAAHSPSPAGAVAGLTLAVGLGGFAWSGFSVNHLDIAPQHASVLMGLSNTVATLPGIISPAVTGYIVQNKTAAEWKIVFYISSAIYLAGAVFYGTFASGELQPWARVESEATEKKVSGSGDVGSSGPGETEGRILCYTNEAVADESL
ncbi:vesicular glutamate transporter 1-like [Ischnura elegans]|uniref:vesicular glutamate transporter 1-like n=1 Tax=Ischnura elegans TaxID=197161 RepID=UPI001ED8830D|nr:vesicular glutamate transporter 1-like [Ischnura elegans]